METHFITQLAKLFLPLALLTFSFSCTRTAGDQALVSRAGMTLCGTVQFSDGCGEETDSLIAYGLALTHHMTYEEAEKVFDQVVEADPGCFWGHWGKALTFIHPLWPDEPGKEKLNLGWVLTQRALQLASTPKETAFGEALAAYYEEGQKKTEWERLKHLEEGWAKAFEAYPDDLEIKSWYALSLLSTADPTDKTYKHQLKAGRLAEEVLQVIPDHPGGFHYTIHAYDYPELAEKAISAANNYSDIAPDVPHALHMPTHIFTRLGMWKESIDWNMRSAKAALKNRGGGGVSMHYFHAVDYILYAHLQRLEDGKAKKIIEDVKSVEAPFQESPTTAYTLAAVEGRYALERQEWAKAASLQARQPDHLDWDRYPEFEALMHFAIGLGGARGGHPEKAEGAIKRLEALEQKTGNPYWVKQIEIQKNTVKAWLAFAKGQHDKALEWMTLAASQENATNKHAITPGELLTASELLGDMLMELEKPDEALVQYELALDRSPRRFNCLYGAGRAAELAGDHARAKAHYEALLEVSADAEAPSPRRDLASNYLRETPNKI